MRKKIGSETKWSSQSSLLMPWLWALGLGRHSELINPSSWFLVLRSGSRDAQVGDHQRIRTYFIIVYIFGYVCMHLILDLPCCGSKRMYKTMPDDGGAFPWKVLYCPIDGSIWWEDYIHPSGSWVAADTTDQSDRIKAKRYLWLM